MSLTVVTGPPCSGKTSWVDLHAGPADVVIDLDRIAHAMTSPTAGDHDHAPTVYRVAQRARWAAITEALRHVDAADVYVIHTQPSAQARQKYEAHSARIITLDPGRDVVLERCKRMRSTEALKVAERWYATRLAGAPLKQASRAW
ncbi:hypothetical protein GCM10023196_035690 [Actinoallomurus vinaceus]|uniref:AAA domain-containing protein n=1 Tax=Actinoallomurus vinaceus TaxID=1080074 RepID=A0ABP8UDH6_9ACTN